MGLLFSTTASPLSGLIRAATWSRWSHVALVDGDASVVESVPFHGVRRDTLRRAIGRAWDAELVNLPCPDGAEVLRTAITQIGKPFDYGGILGLGLRRDWQDEASWFCSELIAWSFAAAGQSLFRAEAVSRITPQHLWMLSPAPESVCARPFLL